MSNVVQRFNEKPKCLAKSHIILSLNMQHSLAFETRIHHRRRCAPPPPLLFFRSRRLFCISPELTEHPIASSIIPGFLPSNI